MGSLGSGSPATIRCKTIDGTELEAWLFEVPGPAPAVIMSHGFNCVKEMSLEDTARAFFHAGYNVLIYDARSVGGSGGEPRNQLNPHQMAEDLSDVVTYVGGLPSVDADKILLWGMSFGGTISAVTATVDRRVAAVLMVAPIFSMVRPDKRKSGFAQIIKERRSQLRGNKPFGLPPFDSKGENIIGYAGSGGPGGLEGYTLMKVAATKGHPNFRDRITLQTFLKLALFQPKAQLLMLEEVPVMMVIPANDDISSPDEQKEVFASLPGPKRMYFAEDAGHMSILTGNGAHEIMRVMLKFFDDVLSGNEI